MIKIYSLNQGLGVLYEYKEASSHEQRRVANEHLFQKTKFETFKFCIVDSRKQALTPFSAIELENDANYCVQLKNLLPNYIVAVVASNKDLYKQGCVWELLAEKTGWNIMIFKDMLFVHDWIGEKYQSIYQQNIHKIERDELLVQID